MGDIVLGRTILDTGPCTDMQLGNMGELADLLDALGNPSMNPGPDDPTGGDEGGDTVGDTVGPVYVNEDGDLVTVDDNGDIIVIGEDGEPSGAISDTKDFYYLVWGKTTYPDPSGGVNTVPDVIDGTNTTTFDLVVAGEEDKITTHVPKDTFPNPSPTPAPVVGTTVTVENVPAIRTVRDDVVYARYNHATERWTTDSLFNAVAMLRARADWAKNKQQTLSHDRNSNSIAWRADKIVVKVDGVDAATDGTPGTGTGTRQKFDGNQWVEDAPDSTVVIHNLSQTSVSNTVYMTADLIDDNYVLSWPDMSGLDGHDKAKDLIVYTPAGSDEYKAAGEECD